MSEEVTDNVAPVEENVAPVQEVVEQARLGKFGELLSYASDDVREAKTWDKFKDVDIPTALKAIVDMDKWTGKRGDIPQADATDEQWKEFYAKIGVPESKDGYEYSIGDELKEALGDSADGYAQYLDKAKEVAHKYNIPAKSVDGFLGEMMAYEAELYKAQSDSQADLTSKAQEMLNGEWGDARDSMEQAIEQLEKHYNISPEDMEEIEANPKTLILLGRIANDLDEKGQVGNVFSQTKIGMADELADVEMQIRSVLDKNGRNLQDKALDPLLARRDRIMNKMS